MLCSRIKQANGANFIVNNNRAAAWWLQDITGYITRGLSAIDTINNEFSKFPQGNINSTSHICAVIYVHCCDTCFKVQYDD